MIFDYYLDAFSYFFISIAFTVFFLTLNDVYENEKTKGLFLVLGFLSLGSPLLVIRLNQSFLEQSSESFCHSIKMEKDQCSLNVFNDKRKEKVFLQLSLVKRVSCDVNFKTMILKNKKLINESSKEKCNQYLFINLFADSNDYFLKMMSKTDIENILKKDYVKNLVILEKDKFYELGGK